MVSSFLTTFLEVRDGDFLNQFPHHLFIYFSKKGWFSRTALITQKDCKSHRFLPDEEIMAIAFDGAEYLVAIVEVIRKQSEFVSPKDNHQEDNNFGLCCIPPQTVFGLLNDMSVEQVLEKRITPSMRWLLEKMAEVYQSKVDIVAELVRYIHAEAQNLLKEKKEEVAA